jgi:7-cyano-7-deazaguanine reductase
MKALGNKTPTPDKPTISTLETFKNPEVDTIKFTTKEFTSKCPVTGQPDFAEVSILYKPAFLCLESKSLKLYLQSYRNEQAFIETLVVRIYNDILNTLYPTELTVTIKSNPRGGVGLKASKSKGV